MELAGMIVGLAAVGASLVLLEARAKTFDLQGLGSLRFRR